jgi:regulator of protease activity HflC (stomatin/prohibitin superfamily)
VQIAQTTLRSVLGQSLLDDLLTERDKLNHSIQNIIDEQTERWGIKVTTVEIKDVELPTTMQRAMAKQAEAEREKRAKVLLAQGEFQAAQTLADAAHLISTEPAAITLRYLQTLTEIAAEKNSTVVFPLPIDLVEPLAELLKRGAGMASSASQAVPPSPIAPTMLPSGDSVAPPVPQIAPRYTQE